MPETFPPVSDGWSTAEATYEGFPLYLRRPTEIDYSQSARFPVQVVIEHSLEKVRSSGLPEPEYNRSLLDFDGVVVELFEESGDGYAVLVETFAGKRIYYFYVSSETDVQSRFDTLAGNFPEHELALEQRSDSDWSFLKRYAEGFGFLPVSE